ncbi:uncharacterized protein PAN0_011c4262 [Moesziomyces antarcticus]|uniref:Nuclear fusion protein KAR5 n=1 Tax=Pseudozyma antarctica TaxID=84753 RepID=A0A081CH94_PSEA2|nr:uncharacterized protein PAN0_011c4262 [Moesziomyces antarcticus]GAK66040.1 hypothetical protein PAN0_011c4262 [Moesziomyces antarcticus]
MWCAGHLAKEASGHDCYAAIYDGVKAGCSVESDMSPHERMLASVQLTLCDLQASSQSVPWECQSPAHEMQAIGLANCVEALSRSTRLWSSYAGYLREIPQMCFALQRWKDIVEENVELSRLWQQHAYDRAEAVKEESLARQDWMRQAAQLRDQLREVLLNVLSDMTANQEKYSNDAEQVLQLMRQAGTGLEETARSLLHSHAEAHSQHLEGLHQSLDEVLDRYELRSEATAERISRDASHSIETRLASPLGTMQDLVAVLDMHTISLGYSVQDERDLLSELVELHREIEMQHRAQDAQLGAGIAALQSVQSDLHTLGTAMNATHDSVAAMLVSPTPGMGWFSAAFALERVVLWALGAVEGTIGLGTESSGWRWFRWLLLVWPLSLKVRAWMKACAPVCKVFVSAVVCISMLIKAVAYLGTSRHTPKGEAAYVVDKHSVRVAVGRHSMGGRRDRTLRASRIHCPSAQ